MPKALTAVVSPPEEVKSIPAEKLLLVHVSDCENRPKDELENTHRLYPGEGVIPLRDYLGALKETGYEGFLSIEIFRPDHWKDSQEGIIKNAKEPLDAVLGSL